jgi:hypothetical protein
MGSQRVQVNTSRSQGSRRVDHKGHPVIDWYLYVRVPDPTPAPAGSTCLEADQTLLLCCGRPSVRYAWHRPATCCGAKAPKAGWLLRQLLLLQVPLLAVAVASPRHRLHCPVTPLIHQLGMGAPGCHCAAAGGPCCRVLVIRCCWARATSGASVLLLALRCYRTPTGSDQAQ